MMPELPTSGLFITGTDTDVGKTYITAMMARQLRAAKHSVGICKPVVSGAVRETPSSERKWEDVESAYHALDGQFSREQISPHRLDAPLAPPVAANRESRAVTLAHYLEPLQAWSGQVRHLIIEGVGGVMCPITDSETVLDWIAAVGCPSLVVSRLTLGTLNHTLLTLEALRHRNLPVAGVVLSDAADTGSDLSRNSNPEELSRLLDPYGVPLLGVIHRDSELCFDWQNLFGPMKWRGSAA